MPLDAIFLAIALAVPTVAFVVMLVRKPSAWRKYSGRYGLAIAAIALVAVYVGKLHAH